MKLSIIFPVENIDFPLKTKQFPVSYYIFSKLKKAMNKPFGKKLHFSGKFKIKFQ